MVMRCPQLCCDWELHFSHKHFLNLNVFGYQVSHFGKCLRVHCGVYLQDKAGSGEGEFTFHEGNWTDWSQGGIAFATDGSFYVADTVNQRIQKFAPDRSFLLAWGSEGSGDGPVPLARRGGPRRAGTRLCIGR